MYIYTWCLCIKRKVIEHFVKIAENLSTGSGLKILTRFMLIRLCCHISEITLPETQCGFRKNRSTCDMIFCARQLQEKCNEQNTDLYMAFIDLQKAFDTVNRELLWIVLEKLVLLQNSSQF